MAGHSIKKNRKIKSQKPLPSHHDEKLWRIIDGCVRDTFNMHPEYLTTEGQRWHTARRSLVKRIWGGIYSFEKGNNFPLKKGRSESVSAA